MALKTGDTLLNGQYEIVRQLGRGGFGFVYLANDRLLGEQVALKELLPGLVGDETILKRFLAEARATIRLTHERIVRTYNVFSEGGNYYISMEYMAGGTLEERLKDQPPVPPGEAARIAAEVCEGLHYAHQRGVVHCDLKPANILFTTDPGHKGSTAKVGDFGIAHISDQLVDRTWHTSLGFVAGTLPYMSPEQAEGVRNDPRIDVYALGAVLYRMLTGRSYLEFDQRTTPAAQVENVMRIRSRDALPPSSYVRSVPGWLDAIALKALAKQTGDRYTSAEEMRQALLRSQAAGYVEPTAPAQRPATAAPRPAAPTGRPATAAPDEARPRARTSLPRWFWLLAGAVVLLCVGIGLVAAILLSGDGGQATPPVTFIVVAPDTATPPPPAPPTDTLPPDTPPPEPPTAGAPLASVYRDDFSNESSGWSEVAENDTETGYQAGEYRIAINRTDYVAWGNPSGLELADYQVEVDARAVAGPVDNNYGLQFRYQEATNDFYWFQISSDGYYAVDLYFEGQWTSVLSWQTSTAIQQGLDVTNHLAVVCAGDQYSLYANGVLLADVSDASLSGGSIGLATGSFDEAGVVVHFDNVVVSPLP